MKKIIKKVTISLCFVCLLGYAAYVSYVAYDNDVTINDLEVTINDLEEEIENYGFLTVIEELADTEEVISFKVENASITDAGLLYDFILTLTTEVTTSDSVVINKEGHPYTVSYMMLNKDVVRTNYVQIDGRRFAEIDLVDYIVY